MEVLSRKILCLNKYVTILMDCSYEKFTHPLSIHYHLLVVEGFA